MTRYFIEMPAESGNGRRSTWFASCSNSPEAFETYVQRRGGRMLLTEKDGYKIAEMPRTDGKYFLSLQPHGEKIGIEITGASRETGRTILDEMLNAGLEEVDGSEVVKRMTESALQTHIDFKEPRGPPGPGRN